MPIPKNVMRDMKADGKTIEDVAKELNGEGDFSDVIPVVDDTTDPVAEGTTDATTEATPDGTTGAPGTTTPDDPADTTTTPVEAATDPTPEPTADLAPEGEGNIFDLGLSDDDLAELSTPATLAQPTTPTQPDAPAVQPTPASKSGSADLLLTREEVELLGGEGVAKVVTGLINRARSEDLRRIQQLEAQTTQIAGSVSEHALEAFRNNVAASVDQYQQVTSSRAWQKYLKEFNPFTGTANYEALMAADARMDMRSVVGIFDDFKAKYGPSDKGKPSPRRDPKALAAPSKSTTDTSAGKNGKKFLFKESFIDELDESRRVKKINSVQYQQKVAEYEDALSKGLVEMGS